LTVSDVAGGIERAEGSNLLDNSYSAMALKQDLIRSIGLAMP
jgi:hypothetical protein